jgi:hypothetical protein
MCRREEENKYQAEDGDGSVCVRVVGVVVAVAVETVERGATIFL